MKSTQHTHSWLALLFVFLITPVFMMGCQANDAALEGAIKKYLENNPKVIQAEVDKVLKARGIRGRPPQLSIDDLIKKAIKVGLNNAPTMGPDDAAITIVEFSDFQCPFCNRVVPTMKQVLKAYPGKVRVAFRQHPLPFHKNAMSAAKASLAAHEQGKFWEFHDKLFENQRNLDEANIKKMAKDLGLDVAKFEKSWKSTKFDAQIQEDMKWARANQASGTPAFFVNGVYVKGAKPFGYFKQVIDKLLEAGKKKS